MNYKVLASALFLFVLCILFTLFKINVMTVIRYILESGTLMMVCIAFVIVSILCNTLFVPESNLDVPMFKSNQLWLLEVLVNIATYVALTSTAITLLKALYIQEFYGDIKYFFEFKNYDIYTMFGVSSVLLWFSMFKCWQLLQEALSIKSAVKAQKA